MVVMETTSDTTGTLVQNFESLNSDCFVDHKTYLTLFIVKVYCRYGAGTIPAATQIACLLSSHCSKEATKIVLKHMHSLVELNSVVNIIVSSLLAY